MKRDDGVTLASRANEGRRYACTTQMVDLARTEDARKQYETLGNFIESGLSCERARDKTRKRIVIRERAARKQPPVSRGSIDRLSFSLSLSLSFSARSTLIFLHCSISALARGKKTDGNARSDERSARQRLVTNGEEGGERAVAVYHADTNEIVTCTRVNTLPPLPPSRRCTRCPPEKIEMESRSRSTAWIGERGKRDSKIQGAPRPDEIPLELRSGADASWSPARHHCAILDRDVGGCWTLRAQPYARFTRYICNKLVYTRVCPLSGCILACARDISYLSPELGRAARHCRYCVAWTRGFTGDLQDITAFTPFR